MKFVAPVPPRPPTTAHLPESLYCPIYGAGPYRWADGLSTHGQREHPQIGSRGRSELVSRARAEARGIKPVDREMARATWELVGRGTQ